MPRRSLSLLALLAPALALAQSSTRLPPDAPLFSVQPGAQVRAISPQRAQEGTLVAVDAEGLRLRLKNEEQVRLPFAALSMVEVNRREAAVTRGAVVGGLVVGGLGALIGGLACSVNNGLGESDDGQSVPACALGGGAAGALIGGLVGAGMGGSGSHWKPVWTRPAGAPAPAAAPAVQTRPASPTPPRPATEATEPPSQPEARPAGTLPEP